MNALLAVQDTPPVVGPDLSLPIGQTFIALLLVLALLAGLAWMLRKGLLARRTSQGLNVETALALGERRSLVIVMYSPISSCPCRVPAAARYELAARIARGTS